MSTSQFCRAKLVPFDAGGSKLQEANAIALDFNPDTLTGRSHAEYVEGETLRDMLTEDLIAERIAIDSYREMITYIGADDPTTRRMLEGILAVEEEHADDLQSLLDNKHT